EMNIIEAHNLSKRYAIYQKRSGSIKERVIKDWFSSGGKTDIWALRDVSFALEKGEALGVIGSNGAGKSALLKILSGITQPSSGEFRVRGRVASLLELGAGFHHELSGMENIYLNAAVLGVPKKTIDKALDDIISFAELEKFIHLPVKHYSSGMLVRLGFSVAIHVDADILVLDEVMSVGDADFQEKSSRKIHEFKKNGKTILLVTHNLEQAEEISDKILWLESGRIKVFGTTRETLVSYMREFYNRKLSDPPLPFNLEYGILSSSCRMGSGEALITRVVITDGKGNEARALYTGETMEIEIHYVAKSLRMDIEAVIGVGRYDGLGMLMAVSGDRFRNAPQKGVIRGRFSPLLVNPDRYFLSVALNAPGQYLDPYDIHLRFYEFRVFSKGKRPPEGAVTHPVHFDWG
ncbi:ABC transporter ATP-binding protein, partial [Candidatus Sumerlaeota bacterium]|nr:ABC transporter ATP-binding protein [Candidatus Sumerlaeota bacterium]